jgi:CheY-like chemotaxis protein
MARILVIDDNDDMLTMLQMLLERRGKHEVTTSNSGVDGLDKAFKLMPDVMIVDIMMPGLNGYDVVNRIRADNRTKAIPIIILTARGQPVDRHAALEAGANSHLAKPVDIQVLLSTIENLLEIGVYANIPEKLVVPIMSLRGGVGVTTIAVNLALLLQQVAPTILWDFSPSSGHDALNLGLQPKVNWASYLQSPDESVNDLLLKHTSGLRLLAAPPVPEMDAWFTRKSAHDLFTKLLPLSGIIVMDMPSFLDEATAALLQEAHHIILVSGDDNPGIQTTLATIQSMSMLLTKKEETNRLMIVRNATTPLAQKPVDILQGALGHTVSEDIPFDEAQGVALRRGIPLAVSNPISPLVMKLKHLVPALSRDLCCRLKMRLRYRYTSQYRQKQHSNHGNIEEN